MLTRILYYKYGSVTRFFSCTEERRKNATPEMLQLLLEVHISKFCMYRQIIGDTPFRRW